VLVLLAASWLTGPKFQKFESAGKLKRFCACLLAWWLESEVGWSTGGLEGSLLLLLAASSSSSPMV